jgi:hypothetical protein
MLLENFQSIYRLVFYADLQFSQTRERKFSPNVLRKPTDEAGGETFRGEFRDLSISSPSLLRSSGSQRELKEQTVRSARALNKSEIP